MTIQSFLYRFTCPELLLLPRYVCILFSITKIRVPETLARMAVHATGTSWVKDTPASVHLVCMEKAVKLVSMKGTILMSNIVFLVISQLIIMSVKTIRTTVNTLKMSKVVRCEKTIT